MRPPIVTVLAVLKFLSAAVWAVLGVAFLSFAGDSADDAIMRPLAVAIFVLAGLAVACGYGLWTLRPYGRYLQIGFSILGLIWFPIGTVISILILVYMFKTGVRVLFSSTPVESLSAADKEQLRSLQSASATAVVIAILVAIPVALAVMGIMAAIAIPNLLNAIDRAKQKRTMADMRAIGTAVESYGAAKNGYPAAASVAELQAAIEPAFIKTMPVVDGWGNAFQVASEGTEYTIYSQGKDKTGDDCTPGTTTIYNDEICFAAGQFTRYPSGSQQ